MANKEADESGGIARFRGFGQRVKRAREDQGFTQRQLAEILEEYHRIKLDSSAITRIENGSREPRITEALAIADILNFPLTVYNLGDEIGGEAQFASAEERLKRQMILARRRILTACAEVQIAFDGIFGDEEELEILQRRGVRTSVEWAEKVANEMAARFRVREDESGASNHAFVTDSIHRRILEIIVGAITSDLYRTEAEIFEQSEEEKALIREGMIRRAQETLMDAYGEVEFQRRFGDRFDDPDA
ncbi:helix-turn-helix domain-containing protein [Mycolicibacterium brisbanense]|uniref:Helix-turn-helix family protein n=1 Tax=Mycolicibacterium brisbanense TaxID=146020 RepID=A0A100VX17_9MYCO|nr:helix-turn-helix transcriptional regulator [Mycolicibacterium brisbanense]MCV7159363.1 helix-turn-helix transcriptional regulator [Mycolicibacterium brisbanense]GAS87550.1 helix-turn-helix family protein [Mycolicibacterium brisbanense]